MKEAVSLETRMTHSRLNSPLGRYDAVGGRERKAIVVSFQSNHTKHNGVLLGVKLHEVACKGGMVALLGIES
jgi:hypothetical protein